MRATKAWRVTYRGTEEGAEEKTQMLFGYSVDAVVDKFCDAGAADEGWELVKVERPKDSWGKVDTKFDRERE